MTTSKVIDEQGNPQTWTAVYWRHFSRCEEQCDSLDEAITFLADGEDYGSLSAVEVRGPGDEVVVSEEEIFDACYGHGRWTPERREATVRELVAGRTVEAGTQRLEIER